MRSWILFAIGCLPAVLAVPSLRAGINVYAAASLTDALKEIGADYEKQTGVRVSFNFAASNTLARQIEEGAPADLFFSADDAQIDRLERSNHLEPETRQNLLSNALVIIAPAESKLTLTSPAELTEKTGRIAIADPQIVPVGVYTRAYLSRLELWPKIEPKVIPVENVRAAAAAVESGNVDAGFVYKTDALISKRVKVIFSVPAEETPEINYPVALLRAAANRSEAEKFLRYLSEEKAREVFERFGFIVRR